MKSYIHQVSQMQAKKSIYQNFKKKLVPVKDTATSNPNLFEIMVKQDSLTKSNTIQTMSLNPSHKKITQNPSVTSLNLPRNQGIISNQYSYTKLMNSNDISESKNQVYGTF